MNADLRVLFTRSTTYSEGAFDNATLVVQPLPTDARKVVLGSGYYGRYLPSGHLVWWGTQNGQKPHWSLGDRSISGRRSTLPHLTAAPSLSSDGLTLYVASNRPGGAGGNDL